MNNEKEYIIFLSIDSLIECSGWDEFNKIVCEQTHEDLQDINYELTGYSGDEVELTITGYIEEE